MKKKTIIACIGVTAAVLLAGVLLISFLCGEKFTEGKYFVENFEDYPDAYIEVMGNKIQFYNIDLNAIYREEQIRTYKKLVDYDPDFAIPEDELEIASDLNDMFVNNPYEIVYSPDNQIGTFEYLYHCYRPDLAFGLVLKYDSFHKTFLINNYNQKILFKR